MFPNCHKGKWQDDSGNGICIVNVRNFPPTFKKQLFSHMPFPKSAVELLKEEEWAKDLIQCCTTIRFLMKTCLKAIEYVVCTKVILHCTSFKLIFTNQARFYISLIQNFLLIEI